MPLGERLSASEFNLGILRRSRMLESPNTHTNLSNADVPFPDYYVSESALILSSCTDASTHDTFDGMLAAGETRIEAGVGIPTIENALVRETTQPAVQQAINENKVLIIPVVEYQAFWGMSFLRIPRNHYVTLHYNPETNTASLLDSTSAIVAFLYSIEPMKAMLQQGLRGLKFNNKPIDVEAMQFDCYPQGVQYDNTFCAYWTAVNILDLAGITLEGDGSIPPTTIAQQYTKYNLNDLANVIQHVMEFAKGRLVIEEDDSYVVVSRTLGLASPILESKKPFDTDSAVSMTRSTHPTPVLKEEDYLEGASLCA